MFQVNANNGNYSENLIVDSANPAKDKQGDKWYKIFYAYKEDENGDPFYEKAAGYINGNFIKISPISDFEVMMIF